MENEWKQTGNFLTASSHNFATTPSSCNKDVRPSARRTEHKPISYSYTSTTFPTRKNSSRRASGSCKSFVTLNRVPIMSEAEYPTFASTRTTYRHPTVCSSQPFHPQCLLSHKRIRSAEQQQEEAGHIPSTHFHYSRHQNH